jgi:hypothetical protein
LSTCVGFGTGARILPRSFSWRHGVRDSPALKPAGIAPQVMRSRICLRPPLHAYPRATIAWVPLAVLVPPFGQTDSTRYRNINLLAIDYAFRPRLRTRLTLGRRTLPRNPWTIGGGDSHPSFVTHAGILTSQASTTGFRRRFAGLGTLSYRAIGPKSSRTRSFGV